MSSIFCVLHTLLYVLGLYALPVDVRNLSRDHPLHVRKFHNSELYCYNYLNNHIKKIKYRLFAATISTLISIAATFYLNYSLSTGYNTVDLLGFCFQNFFSIAIRTIILMILFYLGLDYYCYLHMMLSYL